MLRKIIITTLFSSLIFISGCSDNDRSSSDFIDIAEDEGYISDNRVWCGGTITQIDDEIKNVDSDFIIKNDADSGICYSIVKTANDEDIVFVVPTDPKYEVYALDTYVFPTIDEISIEIENFNAENNDILVNHILTNAEFKSELLIFSDVNQSGILGQLGTKFVFTIGANQDNYKQIYIAVGNDGEYFFIEATYVSQTGFENAVIIHTFNTE